MFAQKRPQALQRDLGPEGPRRIIGVDFELMPQCVHLNNHVEEISDKNFKVDIHLKLKDLRTMFEYGKPDKRSSIVLECI